MIDMMSMMMMGEMMGMGDLPSMNTRKKNKKKKTKEEEDDGWET